MITLTLTLLGGLGSIITKLQGKSSGTSARAPLTRRRRKKKATTSTSSKPKTRSTRSPAKPSDKMKDKDIRAKFHSQFTKKAHAKGSVVIDEFNIGDSVRADIVIASDHLYGIEIKSEADKLDRLPRQVLGYDHTCSRPGIVVHESHLAGALKLISPWWDVYVATGTKDKVILEHERKGWVSEKLRPHTVFDIMWRRELVLEHRQKYPRNHPMHRATFEGVRISRILTELSKDSTVDATVARITRVLKARATSGDWMRSYFIL